MTDLPFRWNLARREHLGSLVHGVRAEDYPGFFDDLRRCCVRVLALAGDSDLIFVGRSPESLFDYLSGVLGDTSWSERCVLLNLSMRYESAEEIARTSPSALRAVRAQFRSLGLAPDAIAASARPQALIDLVARGDTLGHVAGLLAYWSEQAGVDPAALRRRLRFVGITQRTKNSPNTWRWYQQAPWAREYPRRALRSVSVPWELWGYLGNWQKKVSRWHPPMFWGAEGLADPPREEEHLQALRLALALHERGREAGERARFATELAEQPEMSGPWLRKLVLEIRRG